MYFMPNKLVYIRTSFLAVTCALENYRQNMNSMKIEEAQKSYTDIVLVSVKDS